MRLPRGLSRRWARDSLGAFNISRSGGWTPPCGPVIHLARFFQFAAGGGSGGERRPWCGVRRVSAAGAGARRVPFARAFGCAAEDRLRRENSLPTLKQAGNLELRCEELSCAVAGGATGRGRTARNVAKRGWRRRVHEPRSVNHPQPARVPTAEVLSHNFAMTNGPGAAHVAPPEGIFASTARGPWRALSPGTLCRGVRGLSPEPPAREGRLPAAYHSEEGWRAVKLRRESARVA